VPVKTLLREEIAQQRLGQAAVDRSFLFCRYEEFFEFNAHQPVTPTQGQLKLLTASQDGDRLCKCRDCQSQFVFTIGEQEFYKSKNLPSGPSRCPTCSAQNKSELAQKPCADFAQGHCSKGTFCRMKHGDGPQPVVLSVDNSDTKPVVVECRDCQKTFETEPAYWIGRGLSVPKTCKACIQKRKAAAGVPNLGPRMIDSMIVDCAFPIGGNNNNDY
jgi:Zn finger protein HypA/HybF involved in hydrogenase expression